MTQCARQAGTDSKIANSRLSFFFKLMMVVSERVKTLCVCVCLFICLCVCDLCVCERVCVKTCFECRVDKRLGGRGQGACGEYADARLTAR